MPNDAVTKWPVQLAVLGSASVGARLWRFGGKLHVTVAAKLTMALRDGGSMSILAPQPLVTEDSYDRATLMPTASNELVPHLQQADVLMTGHARPPGPTREMIVGLALSGSSRLLFDKSVTVRGELDEAGLPTLFERMPLTLERSYGGRGWSGNPLGTGHAKTKKAPNVFLRGKGHGRHHPGPIADKGLAYFGPLPRHYQARQALLAGMSATQVADGVPDIPENFDWNYWQAAPPDQWVARLRGDEWLAIDGISPQHPRLRTQLPGAHMVARLYNHTLIGQPAELTMRLDRLTIDADQLRCSAVWRGSFPVSAPQQLQHVVVAAMVQLSGSSVQWPETVGELSLLPYDPVAQSQPKGAADHASWGNATVTLPNEDDNKGPALPFPGAAPGAKTSKTNIPGAPWSSTRARPRYPRPPRDNETTAILHFEDERTPHVEMIEPASAQVPWGPSRSAASDPRRSDKPPKLDRRRRREPESTEDKTAVFHTLAAREEKAAEPRAASPPPPPIRARAKPASAPGPVATPVAPPEPVTPPKPVAKDTTLSSADAGAQQRAAEEAKQAVAHAREQAKEEAKQRAAEEEKLRAEAEEQKRAEQAAAERRKADEVAFQRAQEEARLREEKQKRERTQKKVAAAKKLRGQFYGGFKQRR